VNVTANGLEGPLQLGSQDPLSIEVSFDAGGTAPLDPAELYFAVVTPAGVFWWDPAALRFVSTPTRAYAGPLPGFPSTTILDLPSVAALPPGPYWWIVAVDNDTNGVPAGTWLDFVVTTR
jgi:hypothetical protein